MSSRIFRLGVIVNPVAGIGGAVGLAGSDGHEVQAQARKLGGRARASEAMRAALDTFARHTSTGVSVEAVVASAPLGLTEVRSAGLQADVLDLRVPEDTRAADSVAAARAMAGRCDLLLFAGGDGTARDVHRAVGSAERVLGVPGGVKMHSAVFATSARTAGALAAAVALRQTDRWVQREVVDLDEAARRAGDLRVSLYGYLTVPDLPQVQDRKSGAPAVNGSRESCAQGLVEMMAAGVRYALGPGATTAAVCTALGLPATLLGVDVVEDGKLLTRDARADDLERLMRPGDVVVVSPVGGQGFLLGRGNQQFTAPLLERLGPTGILCLAQPEKLASLGGAPLLVDTGDPAVDASIGANVRCVTGPGRSAVYPVAAG